MPLLLDKKKERKKGKSPYSGPGYAASEIKVKLKKFYELFLHAASGKR